MIRDTRKAFRSRAKTMDGIVSAAVVGVRALRDAERAANIAASKAAEAARVKFTRDDIAGATAVRTALYGWRLVRRVNAKTVSVDSGHSWAVLVKFEDVLAIHKGEVKQP